MVKTLKSFLFATVPALTAFRQRRKNARRRCSRFLPPRACSSFPPADAFLGELASSEDVFALSFHVDYWDYIGWKAP